LRIGWSDSFAGTKIDVFPVERAACAADGREGENLWKNRREDDPWFRRLRGWSIGWQSRGWSLGEGTPMTGELFR
jgi:hypothetical protein